MSNTITAYFKGRTGVAESVYQHDYGKILIIDGLTLPATFEVHFTTVSEDDAITVIGQDDRVAIPDSCINKPGVVTAYIYLHTGENDGETEYIIKFAVIRRARPDYDEDDKSDWEKAASQALAMLQNPKKVNTPLMEYNQVDNGIAGQVLRTKGNGATEWVFEGLPTDEQTAAAVSAWLDDHPEATTTVQDGAITKPKLASSLSDMIFASPVNVLSLGVKNDGTEDCSEIINEATQLYDLYFPEGQYRVSNTISPYHRIFGAGKSRDKQTDVGTWFISDGTADVFDLSSAKKGFRIEGVNFLLSGSESAISATLSLGVPRMAIESISIFELQGIGINLVTTVSVSRLVYINDITIFGSTTGYYDSLGIYITGSGDCRVNNLEIMGCRKGVNFASIVFGDNWHIWCAPLQAEDGQIDGASWWGGSICCILNYYAFLSNVYLDTGHIGIKSGDGSPKIITNLVYMCDNSVSGYNENDADVFSGVRGFVTNYILCVSTHIRRGYGFNIRFKNCQSVNRIESMSTGISSYLKKKVGVNSNRHSDICYLIDGSNSNADGLIEIGKIYGENGNFTFTYSRLNKSLFTISLRFESNELVDYNIENVFSSTDKIYISDPDEDNIFTIYAKLEANTGVWASISSQVKPETSAFLYDLSVIDDYNNAYPFTTDAQVADLTLLE